MKIMKYRVTNYLAVLVIIGVAMLYGPMTTFSEGVDDFGDLPISSEESIPPYGQEVSSSSDVRETESSEIWGDNRQREIEEKIKADTPASVTGEKIEGGGTVTDFTTSGSKAFYTIRDKDSKTYYLIIDMDKTENNVYFLSDIDKSDLEQTGTTNSMDPRSKNVPAPNTTTSSDLAANNGNQTTPTQKKQSNSSFLLLVLIVCGSIFAYYYFFKFKKNKANKKNMDIDSDDFMVDEYADADLSLMEDYTEDELTDMLE